MLSIEYLSCINQSIGLFQKCLAAQNYWLHHQTNAKCGMILKYPPFEKKTCDTIDWLPFFLQRFGSKEVDTIQFFPALHEIVGVSENGLCSHGQWKSSKVFMRIYNVFFPMLGHMLKEKKSIELTK